MTTAADSCALVREPLFERARGLVKTDAAVELHLETCDACRALAMDLDAMFGAWRHEARESPEPETLQRVLVGLGPTLGAHAKKPRGARWAWPLAFALSAACAAALLVVGPHRLWRDPRGSGAEALALVATEVQRSSGEGGGATLASNTAIHAGDVVHVGHRGDLLVGLGPQRLRGVAGTRLRFGHTDPRKVELALERGRIVAQVERVNGEQPSFRVSWPSGELVVTGTVFSVSASEQGAEVAVARGRVRVRALGGGESWIEVPAGSRVALRGRAIERETLSDDERSSMLRETLDSPPSALAAPPSSAQTSTNMPEPEHERRATAPRLPGRGRAAEPRDASEAARAGECEQAAKSLGVSGRPGSAARGTALVAVGDCFRARADLDAALDWYTRAASEAPDTPAGENAAYELGRMLVERGRPREAEAAFERYLKMHPRGTFAADAHFARCSLVVDAQRGDDAVACLRAFRERFPKNARRRDTYLLEATVLRVQKADCRAAERAYDEYLADPGSYAREAESWKKWCKARVSRPASERSSDADGAVDR